MKIETIAIHASNHTDGLSKAVIQPITLSTTFVREADGSFPAGYIYSRSSNPNRTSLENVLANYIPEKKHGDKTYFNRNFHIEPTNLCVYDCKFCSYSRLIKQRS
ncbi:MAG: aminotransferase class I/II-fold pyridoxal phosphate-dependent enzyme, partial [Mucilaginibacter sp.]|nr:aminotransferase class I/II-fold pyridoxal phosphate-dependent enzyme [Mucilaginibacter sp.]